MMTYHKKYLTLHWVHVNQVYRYSNYITSAVYAFAWLGKEPNKKTWPCDVKETLYIGMSGGLEDDYIADRKEKHRVAALTTRFHLRMKQHIGFFRNPNAKFGKQASKYNLYHELFNEETTKNKELYCAIMVPKDGVSKLGLRNRLELVESELKELYCENFQEIPVLCLAEKDNVTDSMKNYNSISQQKVREHEQSSLIRFFKND
jgi:hypothetical protein